MDTEERVPAQHFHIPILEVETLMGSYSSGIGGKLVIKHVCDRGVDRKIVIRRIWNRGVDGSLIIGGVCDCEVGESGDAGGRRMSGGSDGSRRNWV